MNGKVKGYMLGIIAAATYGMNPLFALPLYEEGMNVDSVLFMRYLLAVPVIGAMLHMRGYGFRVKSKKARWPLVFTGLLMALSSLTLFKSYTYMAAGIASTLLFVYPIMVAVIMWAFFKEKLSWLTVGCIATACAGIGLLCHGGEGGALSLPGVTLVMVSALSYAVYLVWINRPSLVKEPTLRITFYVLVFGALVFAFRLVFFEDFILPSSPMAWTCVIALAVLPTAVSLMCTTAAIQHIGATPTAILGALEPVTALIFGVSVFNETLTLRDIFGVVLIVVAVTVIVAGGSVSVHLTRFRKMFPKVFRRNRRP